MNQTIVAIAKNFVNILYPLHCAACKTSLDPLDKFGVCTFCLNKIRRNPKPHCRRCGRSIETSEAICQECRKSRLCFERAYSACIYEGTLKKLIGLFKYKRKISLAKILSKLMIEFVEEYIEVLDGIDSVTFVPIQNRRLRERGFNQSEVLAFNLSKNIGVGLIDALKKTRTTNHQNELTRNDRFTNLKDAFEVRRGVKLEGSKILLVDDVMTTGATLSECSKTLLGSGAKLVRCLALARGI